MTGPHSPNRPIWRCPECHWPWPCPPARGLLGHRYGSNPLALARFMARLLVYAARDQPHRDAGEVHAQIMGWIH